MFKIVLSCFTRTQLCHIIEYTNISAFTVCTVTWNVTVQVSEFCLDAPHVVRGTLGLFLEGSCSARGVAGWVGVRQEAMSRRPRSCFLGGFRF